MTAIASARGTSSPLGAGDADPEDSNISSPLSDVDDGDANEDDIQHMQIDGRDPDAGDSSASETEQPAEINNDDESESESALSDAGSDVNSEANDTEAETERLYDTPRHPRQRDVVVDRYNRGQVFEHSPSKLRGTTKLPGDAENDRDDESVSGDDASVASGDDSPTKPAASKDTSIDGDGKRDSIERKRKRSPLTDQSESDQPLRKRLVSIGATDTGAGDETPIDDTPIGKPDSGDLSGDEIEDGSAINQDTPVDSDRPEKVTRAAKNITRNGSKRKGTISDNSPGDTPGPEVDGEAIDTAEEDTETRTEEVEGDTDGAEAAAKSIEEAEKKSAAFRDWSHIEEMFGIFRDRLYKDRLQRIEEEEQSLTSAMPTHPEYLNMKQCLDDRFDRKVREINTEYVFRIEAHERRAVASRAQVWSQFFQAVRERREATLESLNRQWYEVQTARRSAHSLPDYGLLFPKDQVKRVRNAIAYNTEVSTLAGLAKYEGFPAGPELKGASAAELESDFGAIEQVRRSRQRPKVPLRDDYPAPTFTRLGPAGEQFIKDTPWANPNHSAHKINQQTPAHLANRPEAATMAARVNQPGINSSGIPLVDAKVPFESRAPIHTPAAAANRMSESPELSRSVMNPAAQKLKRVSSIPNIGRGSKTAAA